MLVSAQLEMTLSDGTGGREPAIWTYGGDGDLGELFEGFCDGDGRVGHGGTLALLARLWPGRGRGCVTKGAVTGAAPLNFLTPVPSATTCSAQCHSAWEETLAWPCGLWRLDHPLRYLYVMGSGLVGVEISVCTHTVL